jgi:sigma-E factor negative regulatory protein RseC
MQGSVCIEQKGTVEAIINHTVQVRIHRDSACGHCHASNLCNLFEMSERIVEADDQGLEYKAGDSVEVIISRSMGNKAVLWGYLLPLMVLLSVLILTSALEAREWISGIVALGALAPYYIGLYLLRDRLKKSFTFTLRKTE